MPVDFQIADETVGTQLDSQKQAVKVMLHGEAIGKGTLVVDEGAIAVDGIYQLPRAADARFNFTFKPTGFRKCAFAVDWPGLLPKPIRDDDAGYMMLLVRARPRYVIFGSDGSGANATYEGPFHEPEITTALQVSAGYGDTSAALTFVFES
jgi:hypothetical protein